VNGLCTFSFGYNGRLEPELWPVRLLHLCWRGFTKYNYNARCGINVMKCRYEYCVRQRPAFGTPVAGGLECRFGVDGRRGTDLIDNNVNARLVIITVLTCGKSGS